MKIEDTLLLQGYVILGALLINMVTVLFSLYQKNIDYINDFYKKIIDKRMNAFNEIEKQIYLFSIQSKDESGNLINAFMLANFQPPGKEKFQDIYTTFGDLNDTFAQYKNWFQSDLNEAIQEFLDFYIEIDTHKKIISKAQQSRDYNRCIEKALLHREHIETHLSKIKKALQTEFERAWDVPTFLSKRGNKPIHRILPIFSQIRIGRPGIKQSKSSREI